jgi:hypothetical protein
MRLLGISLNEVEFFAGHLSKVNGVSLWHTSKDILTEISHKAAEKTVNRFKTLFDINEQWGSNNVLLYIAKYYYTIAGYGGHHTIFKILIADILSQDNADKHYHLVLGLPSGFTQCLFENIKGRLDIHTYSFWEWSYKKTRLSVLLLIFYVGFKRIQKQVTNLFKSLPEYGNNVSNALLLMQEDDLSMDRSYRGQPHWLFKDDSPPAFRTLVLETNSKLFHETDKNELKHFKFFWVPKDILYEHTAKNTVLKSINSSMRALLHQSLFGPHSTIDVTFQLAQLFTKANMLAGFCHSQNVKAYMTCENYFPDAHAMNLIGPQMGIHTLSYQYSNLSSVNPLLQTTADTMCTFSKIFQERWGMNEIEPRSYVNIGYLFDSSFHLVKERAHLHRKEMEKYGANFIIGYYDESVQSKEDKYGIIHEDDHYFEISSLMKFVINNNDIAVIIKSQFNRNSPGTLYGNDSYMKQAVETNRFLDLHKGRNRNICFPSEAAMAADIVIGHVVGATAGLEAALTGKRCILLNPYNMLGENIELFKKGDILYESIGSALIAIKEFRNGNIKYKGLGDWSPIIDLFDPFRDGKSAKRLRLTLENIMSSAI